MILHTTQRFLELQKKSSFYNLKFKSGLYDSNEIAITCVYNKLVNLSEMGLQQYASSTQSSQTVTNIFLVHTNLVQRWQLQIFR